MRLSIRDAAEAIAAIGQQAEDCGYCMGDGDNWGQGEAYDAAMRELARIACELWSVADTLCPGWDKEVCVIEQMKSEIRQSGVPLS